MKLDQNSIKQKNGIRSAVERLLGSFNKLTPEMTKVYTDELLNRKVDYWILSDAISELIATQTRLPTIKTVLDVINQQNKSNKSPQQLEDEKEFYRQEEKLEQVKEAAKKIFGDDYATAVSKFIFYWYAGVYGKDALKNLEEWGLSMRLFEKPALFDLHQANFDPKKAVLLGRQKLEKTLKARKIEPAVGITYLRNESTDAHERVVQA